MVRGRIRRRHRFIGIKGGLVAVQINKVVDKGKNYNVNLHLFFLKISIST